LSRSARHTFILIVVALSGCLAAFGGWRFAKASAPVNGPIVLISIDSLRADHVGAYGYAKGRTPTIDRLAAESIVFERAYAHVPQTLPAHVALLTGRLPFESGVRDAAGFRIPDHIRTVAEILRDRGYATGGIVSSFLLRRETGIDRGFAFFDSELPTSDERAPYRSLTRDGADSEQVAEHWLDSVGTPRAFLFLHIAEPHLPYTAPARFSDLSPYDAEVAYADEIVGRLITYLKANQLYDRSTIILLSDHGEGLGDHGELGHGLLVSDEALRVPLIVKPPAGDGTPRRVAAPVQHADVVPTILDLAKAPGAGGLKGRSLVPFFSGDSVVATDIYAESLFGAYRFGWEPRRTLIRGDEQLIAIGARDELFDLSKPPGTREDTAGEQPALAADLRKALDGFELRGPHVAPAPVTPTDRERFEALGYVGAPHALAALGAAPGVDGARDAPGGPPASSAAVAAATPGSRAAAVAPATAAAPAPPVDEVQFVERFRSAVQLAVDGDWQKSLEVYRALTRDFPHDADLWLHLAQTAARNERQELAIDAYRQALTIEPRNLQAYLGASASSLRARRLDDAAEYARAVLDTTASRTSAADPVEVQDVQKAEAHELLARIALNRRDADAAREEAAAAEAADPKRPVQSFVEGRIAMEQGRYADAVAAFEQALSAARSAGRPPLADVRVYAAESMLRVDRADDAERLLRTELTAFPANARARATLQSLYRQSGRADEAAALTQH
jgi:arylsulfatase A-like enzyme/tetratricopeptide (TPR) repeat protein